MYSLHPLLFLLRRFVFLGIVVMMTGSTRLFAQAVKAAPQDSLVLLQFRESLLQHGWTVTWDTSLPVVSWQGVELNPVSGKVRTLYLKQIAGSGYQGTALPSSIGLLSQLESLESFYAQQMDLISVPSQIGDIRQLKNLGLNYNKITAMPAEISKLTALTSLFIGNNELTSLPDLHTLTLLTNISISQNPFPVFPESVCDLISLQQLDAYYSNFTSLPETISKLVNLEYLDLKYGKLVTIPSSIGELKKLKELEVERNNINVLPPSMGNLSSLTKLTASFNQIPSLPTALAGLSSLTYIDLRNNKLTGPIPSEIWDRPHPKRVHLDVSNNQLSGPLVISNPAVVQTLLMSGNEFLLTDISPVYNALKSNGATVSFTPQALVGTFRTFHPVAGEPISFMVDSYSSPAGSKFTWYRTNTISPFDIPVKVSEQSLMNIANYDPFTNDGVYFCKITHPDMPGVEQESKRVRLITENKAPTLQVVDATGKESPSDNFEVNTISFRQGSAITVWVWAYGSDDYTPQEDLQWSFPDSEDLHVTEAPTSNYSARKLIITTKENNWSGTNTINISVTDELGLSTTHSIVVNVAPEINHAPVITPIPPVYMREEMLPCEECQEYWIYESLTLLDPFIQDDLDHGVLLAITVPEQDIDAMSAVGLWVSIYNDAFTKEWKLSVAGIFEQDVTFTHSFHLVVADSEGLQTTAVVTVKALPSNDAPFIDVIADQVITRTMTHFTDLDLKAVSHDDHSLPENLSWRISSSPSLTATLQGSIAKISPIGNSQVEDEIIYTVYEKTNELLTSSRTVRYRVVDSGIKITGKIIGENQQPLVDVTFDGFTTKTDIAGTYSVTVVPGWSGTLTPKLKSYSFSPAFIHLDNVQSDFAGQNFTAAYEGMFTISGRITDNMNNPVAGIVLNGLPQIVTTDANGYYNSEVPFDWSGAITPTHDTYTFTPMSINITSVSADLPEQNFSGSIITANDAEIEAKVSVYPNPSDDGKFTLQWPGHSHAHFEVYSMTGQVIVQNMMNTQEESFILPGKGMFVLKLNDGRNVLMQKVVVR